MAVLKCNIVLLGLYFIQIFSFVITDYISKSQNLKCFYNTSESNLALFLNKCSTEFEKCDESCIVYMDTFNLCTDNCKKIAGDLNPDSFAKLDWKCYDTCILNSPNEDFRNLVKCIYEPCKNELNNSSKWYILSLTIFMIIVVIGFGLILLRKIGKEKSAAINESNLNELKTISV